MTATIKLELTLDKLIEAISSLNLEEKCQILKVIEQQIFELEEEHYQDDSETIAELELVRNEYQQGDYITLDDFLSKS
jgi:hypothetical protein